MDIFYLDKNFKMTGCFKKTKKGYNNIKIKIWGKLPKNFKKILDKNFDFGIVKRNYKSVYNEIIAHLFFKHVGMFKRQCNDIDITENESLLRRIIYSIITKLFEKRVYRYEYKK